MKCSSEDAKLGKCKYWYLEFAMDLSIKKFLLKTYSLLFTDTLYINIYISSTEYFLLYFLSKLIVIHSYTDTDRVEIYTI